MTRCAQCREPTDAALCVNCATALRIELGDVPLLLAHLDITRSRQDQLADPYDVSRGGGETPLPFKPHVGEVAWILHDTLSAWVTSLGGNTRKVTTAALAKYLLVHIHHIRVAVDAGQLVDEITHAIRYARRAIDRPDDHRLILGPCDEELADRSRCRQTVYGLAWRDYAVCEACGAQHNIAARQQWLRDLAEGHLGTATEIAGFLRAYGMPRVTASMIRNLAVRGRLSPEPDTRPPLYHVRDVLAALRDRYVPQGKRKHAS